MGAEIVPFPLQGMKPAQAFASLDKTESLAEGIGSSYGVIAYKGKVWSVRHRGERYTITRPDDGSPANHIDVVMLRQASAKSKSYYPSYDQDASDGKRPICSSLNGVVPDADVQQQQSPTCALCPRNVWKTNAEGRKSRECQDYKRLAVLLLPAQTKQLMGTPLVEPVFLRIPPASLNDLAQFGETMSNQGWHYSSFITRISFDPEVAHPKFLFKAFQGLTDAEGPFVMTLREDSLAKRITGEDQVGTRPAAVTAAPAPAAIAAPATVPQAATPPHVAATTVVPASVLAAPAAVVTAPVAVAPVVVEPTAAAPLATGFLELTANPPAEAAPAPVEPIRQTVVDVGEPTASDAALDARIAALVK